MPELPEVETIRRQLEPQLIGRQIIGSASHWSTKFTPAVEAIGTTVERIGRRGKYLIFSLDDGRELIAHLGMTGQFSLASPAATSTNSNTDHVRAQWDLDDGSCLLFRDVRRFGRLHVVDAGDYAAIATLHHMGPEPLTSTFTGTHLYYALQKSRRPVKTQLLSQRPVAGVGNIYADEALFLAGVDPRSRRVGLTRCDRLATAIKTVLQTGIDNGGTTLRDYVQLDGQGGSNQLSLVAYGRGGEPCVECGRELCSTILDARTTTYCGNCQRY